MQIQKVSNFNGYNVFLCSKSNDEKVNRNGVTEPLIEDKFTLSFGAKKAAKKLVPLVIPEDMFASPAKAKEFSKLVEAMRTINKGNFTQKKYKEAAKILFEDEDFLSTYAKVKEFVETNSPEFKSGEKDFDEVFDCFTKALKAKKSLNAADLTDNEKTAISVLGKVASFIDTYGYFPNSLHGLHP